LSPLLGRTITIEGHEYRIIGTGVTRNDGKVYAHLKSTTDFTQQRNGQNPRQICEFINPNEVDDETA
ncbi:MAG TPA: hypothetical protein VKB76_02655, partial [Ktedonobacterales bacterium]|nr:hypothetical protein [Ktedonobacterales bacterium]